MKWFAIFKTGKHTDSSGNTKEWTEADLDKIVESYDPTKHEAPIVIGHPKTNAPAFGWIEKLKRVGDTLYALPKQLANEFVEMVNKGLFKKRSISLYPDGTLRHVGFLGAQPPAVKGLPDVLFDENDNSINYESEPEKDFAELDFIEELQTKINQLQEQLWKYQDLDSKIKNYEEVSNQLETIMKEKKDLESKLNELNRAFQLKEFEEFLNKKIEEGKLLPKQKHFFIEIAFPPQDFSENQLVEKIKDFLESNPIIIELKKEYNEPADDNKNIDKGNLTQIVIEEIRKTMQTQ